MASSVIWATRRWNGVNDTSAGPGSAVGEGRVLGFPELAHRPGQGQRRPRPAQPIRGGGAPPPGGQRRGLVALPNRSRGDEDGRVVGLAVVTFVDRVVECLAHGFDRLTLQAEPNV